MWGWVGMCVLWWTDDLSRVSSLYCLKMSVQVGIIIIATRHLWLCVGGYGCDALAFSFFFGFKWQWWSISHHRGTLLSSKWSRAHWHQQQRYTQTELVLVLTQGQKQRKMHLASRMTRDEVFLLLPWFESGSLTCNVQDLGSLAWAERRRTDGEGNGAAGTN